MTAAELIAILRKAPADAQVNIDLNDHVLILKRVVVVPPDSAQATVYLIGEKP